MIAKGTAHIFYDWEAHEKKVSQKQQRKATAKVEAGQNKTDFENKESC